MGGVDETRKCYDMTGYELSSFTVREYAIENLAPATGLNAGSDVPKLSTFPVPLDPGGIRRLWHNRPRGQLGPGEGAAGLCRMSQHDRLCWFG